MQKFENHTSYAADELSARIYNLAIGAILVWGFAVNAFMCKFMAGFFMEMNIIAVLAIYFIVAISGILMSSASDNPIISFIGYNLVVLPVGMVLSICLVEFEAISILNICIVTAVVTGIMLILGVIFPEFFLSLGNTLSIMLTVVLVVELIMLIFGIQTPSIWDFLVALLFCGYIGFDWAEAQAKPKTLDNAVDSCVALYLDIINLFIRLLMASDDD